MDEEFPTTRQEAPTDESPEHESVEPLPPVDTASFAFSSENMVSSFNQIKSQIDAFTLSIALLCPKMTIDLPVLEPIPVEYQNYPSDWQELSHPEQEYVYFSYANTVKSELRLIETQITRLQEKTDQSGKPFDGSYAACRNLWSSLNPKVRDHIYDIIKPEADVDSTFMEGVTVRHSVDYTVMLSQGWQPSLKYLGKFSDYREESCYSQGRPPGSVVLELNAKVRAAMGQDIESTVNPYTGQKTLQPDALIDTNVAVDDSGNPTTDPETYFNSGLQYKKSLHSHSDELFCRFDIHKDLKRILVSDLSLIPQVQNVLKEMGIEGIPVEYEDYESSSQWKSDIYNQ